MTTTETLPRPLGALGRPTAEIRNLAAVIRSDTATRHDHPAYGVTKARLWSHYCRLEGMLAALAYATGTWQHAGPVTDEHLTALAADPAIDVDLAALRALIITA